MTQPASRLLIIGLDGATLDVVQPLAAAGQLPHLADLMSRGAWGTLLSTIPPITAPAWVSFMTGKNPGAHGVFDFVRLMPGLPRAAAPIHSFLSIASPTIWHLLSHQGRRLAVINVPFTSPPFPVNGVLVSGLLVPGPGANFTYPPELKEELRHQAGGFALDWNVRGVPVGRGRGRWLHSFRLAEQQRHRAALYLLRTYPWDCAAVVYTLTDRAQHLYWSPTAAPGSRQFPTEIASAYQLADAMVGELLAQAGPDTTALVLSDHGYGSLTRAFNTNTFLANLGLLALQPSRRSWGLRRPTVARLLSRLGMDALIPALPAGLRDLRLPLPLPRRQPQIDWHNTQAYAASWGIRINLAGREPHGTVAPGQEYERLRDQIIAHLRGLSDPVTGERAIASAWRREELYHGPFLDQAPDIVFSLAAPDCLQNSHLGRKTLFSPRPGGTHRLQGMFIVAGPQVAPGPAPTAHITDLAPTILHLLGCQVPGDMEGRVLTGCLRADWLARFPLHSTTAAASAAPGSDSPYSQQQEERLKEHLRALGYL